MEICSYNPGQLIECAELFVKVFNAAPWNDRWTSEKAGALLAGFSEFPGFRGFVGRVDGKVVSACFGYKKMWWWGDEFYIEEMFVSPECQGSGLGSELMRHIESALKEENITAIILLTGHSMPAKDFYLKNGFKAVESVVFMKKRI